MRRNNISRTQHITSPKNSQLESAILSKITTSDQQCSVSETCAAHPQFCQVLRAHRGGYPGDCVESTRISTGALSQRRLRSPARVSIVMSRQAKYTAYTRVFASHTIFGIEKLDVTQPSSYS